ncbi:hypothetical protein F4679DRAFT_530024 [Xylaria curta]|nr:hypothetical protein F4679DRAFT_530024 [Xylaria curta]
MEQIGRCGGLLYSILCMITCATSFGIKFYGAIPPNIASLYMCDSYTLSSRHYFSIDSSRAGVVFQPFYRYHI